MYKHVGITSLVSPSPESTEALKTIADAARNAGHEGWLDGVPVIPELYALGAGVRRMIPSVKFYGSIISCNHDDRIFGGPYRFSEVHAVVNDSPYSTARIGYGKYRGQKGDRHYMVDSRGISNEKYMTGREQYSMKLASKLEVAVKNAVANMIPHTPGEIAKLTYEKYTERSVKAGQSKANKLPALMNAVSHSALLNEIRALHAQGATFITPEFQAIVDNMDEAVSLANEERSKRIDATLVHFTQRSGRIIARCVTCNDIRRHTTMYTVPNSEDFEMDAIPPYIAEKVAVLQTLERGNHVDGVGMKVIDTLYWVEK